MIKLSRIKQELVYAANVRENLRCERLARNYVIAKRYKRIYFYHVKKCGGLSLSEMFLSLSGRQNGHALLDKIYKNLDHRVVSGDKVYVGYNQKLIEEGSYYYAFSHMPKHEIQLPPDTFTITALRDPVERIFSHYRMNRMMLSNNIRHPALKREKAWMGNSFSDFLDRAPREILLRQLYMFSKTFDPDEAFENIARCSFYYFIEDLSGALRTLSSRLDVHLKSVHANKTSLDLPMAEPELDKARRKLKPCYDLIGKLRKHISAPPQAAPKGGAGGS